MFGDPFFGITPMPKMSLKMKIIARGKIVGVEGYLKAKKKKNPNWVCQGLAIEKVKVMFSK